MYWKSLTVIVATASLAGTVIGNNATLDPAMEGEITWDANSCSQCHSQSSGLNHPVGISSQKTDLPLANGRIDCLTCHTSEATSPKHTGGFQQNQAGLLRKAPAALCSTCHWQEMRGEGDGSAMSHGVMMRKAHLEQKSTDGLLGSVFLDSETRQCLSCHDGSFASHSGVRTPSATTPTISIESMHPIGVRYSSTPKGRMAPQYRPVSSLPNAVRLFDGKLGCGSCHSIYSGKGQLMAVNPKRGELCLTCHIK